MLKKEIYISYLLNIKTWIITLFFIRLYGILNTPIEILHNWRQTTVTMVARNFLEIDNNILYPRLDIGGELTGITAMEFPFFNYLIYLCSLLFGYDHWYGRLINLTVSSFGLYYFYLFIKKYLSKELAFNATLILLFSIWFNFSRKIMPDTFATSFIIIGLYYGFNYLKEKASIKNLLLYVAFTLLGVLAKLPVGYLLIIYVIPLLSEKLITTRKTIFSISTILLLIPTIWWYFIWTPYLTETYKLVHFFMGKSISTGFYECIHNLDQVFQRFYESPLHFSGFIMYCVGLIYLIKKKYWELLIPTGLLFFSFSIIMFKAGFTFYHHNYYIIPFTPLMAVIVAYAISQFSSKWSYALLCIICLNSLIPRLRDFSISTKRQWANHLENSMDSVSKKNDLIFINQNQTPTYMYCAHRRGWINSSSEFQNTAYRNELIKNGCKYAIIVQDHLDVDIKDYELPYLVVLKTKNYWIYNLQK